jgi:CheY-like chemotaxis protein
VASTLLAVDDSLTMRRVLEITFAGPDFRVVTATGPDDALQKVRAERPSLVIADVTLEPRNGYDLCKQIKQVAPGTPVIILSSKQNPYDAARGSAAQADDHMDKPFDTTQMIDKVKKLLEGKPAGAGVAAAAAPQARPAVVPTSPMGMPARQPPPMAAAAAPVNATAPNRAKTLIGQYSPGMTSPSPAGASAPAAKVADQPFAPTPVSGVPLQQRGSVPNPPPQAQAPAQATTSSATAAHVNGQMAARLEDLGLTPSQIDAVIAISRDVVERVVWEVVPVLAETIIKEEIARLTK